MTTHTPRPVLADVCAGSLAAVDVAAAEAALRGLPLRLVRARPQPTTRPTMTPAGPPPDTDPPVGEALRRVADSYPDLAVSIAVRAGDPASVLINEAQRAELVVVGQQRPTGPGGGVAGEVASHADCPVIVTPAGARDGRRMSAGPVVVGVQGGDRDAPAVAFGLAEAALHEVPLQVVHVWLNIPDMELASVDPFVYDLAEAGRDADRLIQATLAGWAGKYPQVRVERVPIYQVDVADTLTGVSAQASMLVLSPPHLDDGGTRLLGHVSLALIDASRCPVALAR